MTTPSDPFSEAFDSINIDPAHVPSVEAIDHALSFCGPPPEAMDAPGFYLLNDADGRFVIDRDWGVISLADEGLLDRERGAIHVARLRVVEQSGESYELDLKLRLSGRVPQLVADEDAHPDSSESLNEEYEPYAPKIHWTRYVAVAGLYTPASLEDDGAPFGSLLTVHTPCVAAGFAGLTLIEDLPAPSMRTAIWSPQ